MADETPKLVGEYGIRDRIVFPNDKPSTPSKVELAAAIGKAISNLAIISVSILALLKKSP